MIPLKISEVKHFSFVEGVSIKKMSLHTTTSEFISVASG